MTDDSGSWRATELGACLDHIAQRLRTVTGGPGRYTP